MVRWFAFISPMVSLRAGDSWHCQAHSAIDALLTVGEHGGRLDEVN
jgi:hypothetical protein